MISELDLPYFNYFTKIKNIFSSWKILPLIYYLWQLHVNFDLGRHQSTFYSRFNNLLS